jgi:hypothetical protein
VIDDIDFEDREHHDRRFGWVLFVDYKPVFSLADLA